MTAAIPVGAVEVEELQRDERGGEAEADDIGQAVELSAEIGGVAGEPRQPAVEGVEDHGQEDQICRGGESARDEETSPWISGQCSALAIIAATYIAAKPQTALPSVARLGRK